MQDNQASNIDLLTNSMKDLSMGLQTLDAKVDQYIRRQNLPVTEESFQQPTQFHTEQHGSPHVTDCNSPI